MGWLPWPVLPKRRWPVLRFKEKRAVTKEEHALILDRETNSEMRAFLWCCWHLGGSQSDVAHLKAEDVDWEKCVVSLAWERAERAPRQPILVREVCPDAEQLMSKCQRQKASYCDKFVAAFCRFLPPRFCPGFFRKPELRRWCLGANGVSKAFTSTRFDGWRERRHATELRHRRARPGYSRHIGLDVTESNFFVFLYLFLFAGKLTT
jgi:hypothetical protein